MKREAESVLSEMFLLRSVELLGAWRQHIVRRRHIRRVPVK